MAIKLIANYSKKLGLPNFSSVQFSLTVETEVSDLNQVETQSHELYDLLLENVDRELQNPGFVPEASYGKDPALRRSLPGRNGNGNGVSHTNGSDEWACSPKQKDLILKLCQDHQLDKQDVEDLARERFNKPVKTLNKLEASGLIEELIQKYGKSPARRDRR
jgi:hypothetical protein